MMWPAWRCGQNPRAKCTGMKRHARGVPPPTAGAARIPYPQTETRYPAWCYVRGLMIPPGGVTTKGVGMDWAARPSAAGAECKNIAAVPIM